ncbi:23.5 kDa heat shock protein- mitochondrial [Striga hermonthica]|uniref:23.5 kDa heat shock protein- mitochondrial n=1 Tax=Striga hermonthica TaxID=68872 RepID=A0A9N7NP35_STRHE|nr:23.5 kDa heat shock protein- mitochondrial [Striga hermonthica]
MAAHIPYATPDLAGDYEGVYSPYGTAYEIPGQSPGAPSSGSNGYGYKVKATAEGMHLAVYMPGVRKENARVWAENDELHIVGKKKDFEDEEEISMGYRIGNVPETMCKLREITAEMKDGLLKIFVPRLHQVEGEAYDGYRVRVE